MAPLTMMDFANQEWGLVMLTSCPRCQHTFRSPCCSPCCGPCCPSFPAAAGAHPTVGPTRSTATSHASTISLSGGCISARTLSPPSCCGGPRSPDSSPLLPLSFVLPCPPVNPKPHVPLALHNASDLDLQRISVTLRCLKSSGWYYEGLTWQESISLLAPTSPGTFLVRESSNPSYLFSLSLQAEKGPTSVRIHYVNGYFRLDAEPSILPAVPLFDCVVKMIEYYIYTSQEPKSNRDLVFLDRSGAKYSSILLRRPLLRKAPSLQHLARLKVNKMEKNGESVPNRSVLPQTLKDYLKEYPYAH